MRETEGILNHFEGCSFLRLTTNAMRRREKEIFQIAVGFGGDFLKCQAVCYWGAFGTDPKLEKP